MTTGMESEMLFTEDLHQAWSPLEFVPRNSQTILNYQIHRTCYQPGLGSNTLKVFKYKYKYSENMKYKYLYQGCISNTNRNTNTFKSI